MKKICLASASLLFFFSACNNDKTAEGTQNSSMAQKNMDAAHVVNKAFETGDVSGIDSVVAADFVDHGERGNKNRDSLKAGIKMMHTACKDMKMDMMKELADDEYVFEMMHFTGSSDGSMGMPAGPYDMHAIEVVKFKNGKAVEHWEYMEPAEMMKMMQQMPAPDKQMASAKMDSVKAKK